MVIPFSVSYSDFNKHEIYKDLKQRKENQIQFFFGVSKVDNVKKIQKYIIHS